MTYSLVDFLEFRYHRTQHFYAINTYGLVNKKRRLKLISTYTIRKNYFKINSEMYYIFYRGQLVRKYYSLPKCMNFISKDINAREGVVLPKKLNNRIHSRYIFYSKVKVNMAN